MKRRIATTISDEFTVGVGFTDFTVAAAASVASDSSCSEHNNSACNRYEAQTSTPNCVD